MSNSKKGYVTVEVDMENEVFVKKLKAISKHAEALTKELEDIESKSNGYTVDVDTSRHDVMQQINRQVHNKMMGR